MAKATSSCIWTTRFLPDKEAILASIKRCITDPDPRSSNMSKLAGLQEKPAIQLLLPNQKPHLLMIKVKVMPLLIC
jgi:hypothetical protein